MKKSIKLILEIDLDIEGKEPDISALEYILLDSLNENMPVLIFDSEELDCQIFTEAWRYEVVKTE